MINRRILKAVRLRQRTTTITIITLLAVIAISTGQGPYVHGATPSPGFRSYLGNCLLTTTPSTPQANKGTTLTGDWTTSAGASCNGIGYVSATAGTAGGLDRFNVAGTAEFDDGSFSVPNIGQSSTIMTLSGDYMVLGYVAADAAAGGPSTITTSASFMVTVILQQTSIANPGTWTQIYSWVLHGNTDWTESCSAALASWCSAFVALSGGVAFSGLTYALAPGYSYRIGIQFQAKAILTTFLAGTGLGMSCGDYTNLPSFDDCHSVPSPINGGNLPVQPSSSCPSGSSSNPCYYVQWLDSTTTLVDGPITNGFSISASPSSWTYVAGTALCVNQAVGTTITVQSFGGFSGNVYLSGSLPPSSPPTTPYYQPTYNPVVVPVGGFGSTYALIRGATTQPWGTVQTFFVTVTGTSGSLSHSTTLTVDVTSYCDMTPVGGSVPAGSKITMSDGSTVPVQDLRVGSQVIVYDIASRYQTTATITQILAVSTTSLLTLHISAGIPFRADANPRMKLHVLVNGEPILKPITEIRPGDQIYNWNLQSWVSVTSVTTAYGGTHTMYDLVTDPLHSPSGAVLEYIANGYPDCPQACKV